jgi:hypothetical protein
MKRKAYRVECNGVLVAEKFAWNTARRAIPALVRDRLTGTSCTSCTLLTENVERDERGQCVRGVQRWKANDGTMLTYRITKTEEA